MGKGEGMGEAAGGYQNRRNNNRKGGGSGDCSCCSPCCGCMPLKKAALICGVVWCIIASLWLLWYLVGFRKWCVRGGNANCRDGDYSFLISQICFILLAAFHLVCSIMLMCGSCKQDVCKTHFFCWGTVGDCVISVVLAIGLTIWCIMYARHHNYNVDCYDDGFLWFGLFWPIFLWYPWWVAYAYYYQLSGKSWCDCGCT